MTQTDNMPFETLGEECGVFGIFCVNQKSLSPAAACYHGLYALQHRGQESCGIAVSDGGVVTGYKGMGLVGEVFTESVLNSLQGQIAVSHARYSTAGASLAENAQPLIMRYAKGRIAIAHNGNLTNAVDIRNELSQTGAMFQTTTDSEVISHIIAKNRISSDSIEQAVIKTVKKIKGAYSLLVMSPSKLIAARDPFGFRPLSLGELDGNFIVASETCALDTVGAKFVRDIEPGEVALIDKNGIKSFKENCSGLKRTCIFEYIYFARSDSVIDGISVHEARLTAGKQLALEHPANADVVIGVPDSGLDAAIGFSRQSGIPYAIGFVRNNYVGRTFIKPTQSERSSSIGIKLNVLRESVEGKSVVMVDDSIVRGTTCANIVRALKNAGAREVHVRISSPTVHWPCYFGTDIPTRQELSANHHTVEEMCNLIGADSLGFLDKNSLPKLVGAADKCFCDACFTGDYPISLDEIHT